MFIVFEGIDGLGKTTQLTLLGEYLEGLGRQVVKTREPGGTKLGADIREMVLRNREERSLLAESLLFAADRAQNLTQVIRPALDMGKVVLADRYFYSTLAYQGTSPDLFERMCIIHSAISEPQDQPDLVFLFDGPRGLYRKGASDLIEERPDNYFAGVRERYLSIARNPARMLVDLGFEVVTKFIVIDAAGDGCTGKDVQSIHEGIVQSIRSARLI